MVTAIAMTCPSSRSVKTAAALAYTSSETWPFAELGDGLHQRERRPLTFGEQAAGLFPGRDYVELLTAHAVLARIARVHIEAERALVDLRGADLDQLAEFGLDVLGCRVAQHHHRLVQLGRRLVDLEAVGGEPFQCLCHADYTTAESPICMVQFGYGFMGQFGKPRPTSRPAPDHHTGRPRSPRPAAQRPARRRAVGPLGARPQAPGWSTPAERAYPQDPAACASFRRTT